jgi:hypothetical protein
MTQRLYYTDAYLRAFEATVERVDHRGDCVVVTLDRTAFYPSSGGQPFDTGTIGSLRVVDVVDEEDGSIAQVGATRRRLRIRQNRPDNWRLARLSAASSTGLGDSITCNSIPASMCYRRHSSACSMSGP